MDTVRLGKFLGLGLRHERERIGLALDASGLRIRANQGHSVSVELGYTPQTPPEILFHGTVAKFLPSIRATGLIKGARHHVHFLPDEATANKVGSRRGPLHRSRAPTLP